MGLGDYSLVPAGSAAPSLGGSFDGSIGTAIAGGGATSLAGLLGFNPATLLLGGASMLGGMAGKSNQSSAGAEQSSVFDSSNWNVNFGGGTIDSTASKSSESPVNWIVMAAGLLALALMVRAWKG